MENLESALAQQTPPLVIDDGDSLLFELPPLIIDGMPIPVERMTQAQLRAFIPLMLKYSTGRGKPGWSKESNRPPWWPDDVPWANVRMDARPPDDKKKKSWTVALKEIIINCYKYHGREDLLPSFEDAVEEKKEEVTKEQRETEENFENQYLPVVFQKIPNSNEVVMQMNSKNHILTLQDGSTAQLQEIIEATADVGDAQVQTKAGDEVSAKQQTDEISSLTEVHSKANGPILLTIGNVQYCVAQDEIIAVPVYTYKSVVANIQELQSNSDDSICLVPAMKAPH